MIILIIEDQDRRFNTIINRLKELIQETKTDYKVIVFSNWPKGLDFYKKNFASIELVILDVRMPRDTAYRGALNSFDRTTGIHIHSEIKTVNPNQKILFWTVLHKEDLEDEGVIIQDDNYVPKSADYSVFFGKIDDLLGTSFNDYFEEVFYNIDDFETETEF